MFVIPEFECKTLICRGSINLFIDLEIFIPIFFVPTLIDEEVWIIEYGDKLRQQVKILDNS